MGVEVSSVINFTPQVPIDSVKLGWYVNIRLEDRQILFGSSGWDISNLEGRQIPFRSLVWPQESTLGFGNFLGRFDPRKLPVSRWGQVYIDDIYVLQWYVPTRATPSLIPSKVTNIIWCMKRKDFSLFYAVPLALGISELISISKIEIDYLTFVPCHPSDYRSLNQSSVKYLEPYTQLFSQTPLLRDKVCNGECLALLVNIFSGIPVIKGAIVKDSSGQIIKTSTCSRRYQLAKQWYNAGNTIEKEEFIRDSDYITGFRCSTLSKRDLEGKKVAIIDDLVTSGSTVNRCAQILKVLFGVGKVYVFAGGKTIKWRW